MKYIKLCQNNSKLRVEQNGHLSNYITLSRGCRQGDPISPYVFVLCAEREWRCQRFSDKEFKLSQYADETTLLPQEDYNKN